jgi:hypothetical protein
MQSSGGLLAPLFCFPGLEGIAMKYDPRLSPPVLLTPPLTSDELILRPVVAFATDGTPVLQDARPVMVVAAVPDMGQQWVAVCKAFGTGQLAVLGYVSAAQIAGLTGDAPAQDLILRAGRAELRLHADGRIRMMGDDVLVQAQGQVALSGATIALN